MSRIGRKPINIPAGVTASIADGVITVKGPKGSLDFKYNPAMTVEVKGDVIEVTRPDDTKRKPLTSRPYKNTYPQYGYRCYRGLQEDS